MSYSDPDIQEAPVYPVMFEIKQENETVQKISPQKSFIIRCSVYVPDETRQEIQDRKHFIYVTLLDSGQPVSQQIGAISLPVNQEDIIMQFAINFDPVKGTSNNQINLQMAITSKQEGEMGIGEALRIGRFMNTYIPLEKQHE